MSFAVLSSLLRPSKQSLQAAQAAAVEEAVAKVQREMLARVPSTPVESAAWLNRMMAETWQPFWQPFLLQHHLGTWQVGGGGGGGRV